MAFRLPEPIVDALLDKLAHDDDFRELFTTDAREALARLGFEPAMDRSVTQGIWRCFRVETLASKESICEGAKALRVQLMDKIPLMPFALETSVRTQTRIA